MAAAHVRFGWFSSKRETMDLNGSILKNLTTAIQSARRLRGHPVHSDTLDHWSNVLAHARRALAESSTEPIETLILELENELADRTE